MSRWVRVGGYGLGLASAAYLFYLLREVLAPFLLASAITYVLEPPVRALERNRVPRVAAILMVYAGGLAVVALGAWFVIPLLTAELKHLAEDVPTYTARLRELTRHLHSDYRRIPVPEDVRQVVDEALARTEEQILGSIGVGIAGLWAVASGVFRVIIAPVLAFYMLRDLDGFRAKVRSFTASAGSRRWLALLQDIDGVVGGFVRGQVMVSLIIGLLTGTVLHLLQVRFATILGILAGLGEFIPYFGPIIAAVPAVFAGLLTSPVRAAQVLLAVAIIQQLDTAVIGPKVLGDRTGLHPLAVIAAVLTGGYLVGPWGLLLAVPVAAVLRVLIKHGYYLLRP